LRRSARRGWVVVVATGVGQQALGAQYIAAPGRHFET
jgi:hypothetical protein